MSGLYTQYGLLHYTMFFYSLPEYVDIIPLDLDPKEGEMSSPQFVQSTAGLWTPV